MKNRWWLSVIGVLAFAITLAIIVGTQLTSITALSVALGIGVGVVIGVSSALLIVLRPGGLVPNSRRDTGKTTIVMSTEQAEMLLKIIGSRKQASPESFPLVAAERQFTTVGGAHIDNLDE